MSRAHQPGSVEIDGRGRTFFVTNSGHHVPYDRARHQRADRMDLTRKPRTPRDNRLMTL